MSVTIHESPVSWSRLHSLPPLVRVHVRLRVRQLDIAAAIDPTNVDPVLQARFDEVSRLKQEVETELEKQQS